MSAVATSGFSKENESAEGGFTDVAEVGCLGSSTAMSLFILSPFFGVPSGLSIMAMVSSESGALARGDAACSRARDFEAFACGVDFDLLWSGLIVNAESAMPSSAAALLKCSGDGRGV